MFRPTLLVSTLLIAMMSFSCVNKKQHRKTTPFEMPDNIGAYRMPYVRYDSKDAVFGGNATRETAFDFNYFKTASEAANLEYIVLHTTDDFISWKVNTPANGVVVRFTLPDKADERGESVGQRSNIDIFVNDQK